MNEKIIVSTITPCYRMKKYLRVFLEQLPKQTFFNNLEVILDHNAPDDDELEWVREFQRKYPNRLKHIIVKDVDPIGVSMNRCISESNGEFLTIWNIDDLRTDFSIETQAKYLIENENVDLVFGDYKIVNKFTSKEGRKVFHKNIPLNEFTRSMIFGPFFMFRKSLCEKAGLFDEQFKSGADFDYAIRLALNGVPEHIESELGYYLDEGLGASTRPNSLQPVERTAIELRYGIYDKLDYDFLHKACFYDIPKIKKGNDWIPVENFVHEYSNLIHKRYSEWFKQGMDNYIHKKKKNTMTAFLKSILNRIKF